MPRYQVKPDAALAHAGTVHQAGALVELPRAIADDMAVASLVQEVDAAGQPVPPTPVDDLERFRSHERVSLLRDRIAAAQTVVTDLETRLAREEQTLVDLIATRSVPTHTPAPTSGAEAEE